MLEVVAQWDYRSDGVGPYKKGDRVNLDPDMVAWINHDSPGVLVPVEDPPEDPPEKKKRGRPKNRIETGQTVDTRSDGPPKQEEITRETFKAVKDKPNV